MMNTFKGQDNNILKELYPENNCDKKRKQVVIVPHDLTKKLQPLDINVNMSRNNPADINVISKLSDFKTQHASWIVDLSDHLFDNQEKIICHFNHTGKSKAVDEAKAILKRKKINSGKPRIGIYLYLIRP